MKELKANQKPKKRTVKKNSDEPRKPSGFGLPTTVSQELGKFLKLEEGEQIPRTQVTTRITTYIKENGLQNKENGKLIDPPLVSRELFGRESL